MVHIQYACNASTNLKYATREQSAQFTAIPTLMIGAIQLVAVTS